MTSDDLALVCCSDSLGSSFDWPAPANDEARDVAQHRGDQPDQYESSLEGVLETQHGNQSAGTSCLIEDLEVRIRQVDELQAVRDDVAGHEPYRCPSHPPAYRG